MVLSRSRNRNGMNLPDNPANLTVVEKFCTRHRARPADQSKFTKNNGSCI